jgi:hypothetical protein
LRRERAGIVLTIEHRSEPTPQPVKLQLVSPEDGLTHLEVAAPGTFTEDDAPSHSEQKPLEERVLEALKDGPLARTVLRDRLSVKNERLGGALAALERGGTIVHRPEGWALSAAADF